MTYIKNGNTLIVHIKILTIKIHNNGNLKWIEYTQKKRLFLHHRKKTDYFIIHIKEN